MIFFDYWLATRCSNSLTFTSCFSESFYFFSASNWLPYLPFAFSFSSWIVDYKTAIFLRRHVFSICNSLNWVYKSAMLFSFSILLSCSSSILPSSLRICTSYFLAASSWNCVSYFSRRYNVETIMTHSFSFILIVCSRYRRSSWFCALWLICNFNCRISSWSWLTYVNSYIFSISALRCYVSVRLFFFACSSSSTLFNVLFSYWYFSITWLCCFSDSLSLFLVDSSSFWIVSSNLENY